ncbi:5'-nucleotidase [Holothuria leucospilota]|uniref:5'-nucleotidase n=1 Tax=Holothuria leucospilota TaxID=206669 RepID=A0A9Q1BPZ7_HOLLE|nr:5'-nucleotidase [Holothuria leucospilota]
MLTASLNREDERGWRDVSMVIINSGAIRASIDEGLLCFEKVRHPIQAFMIFRDGVELSGRHVMEALEHSVESMDKVRLPGFFLQVSGKFNNKIRARTFTVFEKNIVMEIRLQC